MVGTTKDGGISPGPEIQLQQDDDGFHWHFLGDHPNLVTDSEQENDRWTTCMRTEGLVFKAHPALHRFPWRVNASVANAHIKKALGRQPFQQHKRQIAKQPRPMIDRLEAEVKKDVWQQAATHQTPAQVWDHAHGLTDYQVWTGYRVATRQLNLYHDGRKEDASCKKLQQCAGTKETAAHIFWDCPSAVASWSKLVSHWTGERVAQERTSQLLLNCANRQAPAISRNLQLLIARRFQDDSEAAEKEWKRIWHIMSTVCQTTLWTVRNDVVFRDDHASVSASTARFWDTGLRQLRALTKREHRGADTAIRGARLHACLELFAQDPRGFPHHPGTSHDQLPVNPALISWLRNYQRSCT